MGDTIIRAEGTAITIPERLNPTCPVCGEDEPEMYVVRPLGVLRLICRRCNHGADLDENGAPTWEIEPLSKPWERGDA